MNLSLTHAELSNLITACATSRMRHDSPEWQAGLDAIAHKLYAARDVATMPTTPETKPWAFVWRVGSYGAGKRHWHVYRRINGNQEQLVTATGDIRWFATQQAAQRAADVANAPE